MRILVTGAAGFIGFHSSLAILRNKNEVLGLDNLNDYYDVNLKKDRLRILKLKKNFKFIKGYIEDKKIFGKLKKFKIDIILNLAAQAGVRYSLKNTYSYIQSNISGQLN